MHDDNRRVLIDVTLLLFAFLTFGSGLVQFLCFHVGDGPFRESALGLTRLTWLNLHRLPALIVTVDLVLHVAFNWRLFVAKLRRGISRRRRSRSITEPALYSNFLAAAITGIGLWLLVFGSAPLVGPVSLGGLPHIRHHVVDVHNVAGFLALPLAAHHVAHRWPRMMRGLRSLCQGFRSGSFSLREMRTTTEDREA